MSVKRFLHVPVQGRRVTPPREPFRSITGPRDSFQRKDYGRSAYLPIGRPTDRPPLERVLFPLSPFFFNATLERARGPVKFLETRPSRRRSLKRSEFEVRSLFREREINNVVEFPSRLRALTRVVDP